jgi:hypothetical protein
MAVSAHQEALSATANFMLTLALCKTCARCLKTPLLLHKSPKPVPGE